MGNNYVPRKWECFLSPVFDSTRGQRLRHIRDLMTLDQKAMASLLGISQPMLSRIENGTCDQIPVTLQRLRVVLKNDYLRYVLTGEPIKNPAAKSQAKPEVLVVPLKAPDKPLSKGDSSVIAKEDFKGSKKEFEKIRQNIQKYRSSKSRF